MKVILNPSGSLTAKAQSPQGVSDGSRSSVQPFALTRPASSLMSCAVETHSRYPSPLLRSRPLAQSSCPSMMSQAPVFIRIPPSRACAVWEENLEAGKGTFKAGVAAFSGPYSFATRFEGKPRTNPEELIAAAHAACFSMALSAGLEKAGKPAAQIQTDARCTLEMVNGTPTITKMELKVRGKVPGLDQAGFQKAAEEAKTGCPVSRALKGIAQITLVAKLE